MSGCIRRVAFQISVVVRRLERAAAVREECFLLKALVLANSEARIDEGSALRLLVENSWKTLIMDCSPVAVDNRIARKRIAHPENWKRNVAKVESLSSKKRVPVCQTFFLKVLQITKYRVQTVMKEYFENGVLLTEKRGGDRVSQKNARKKLAVIGFIENLHCDEPHYCRGNTKRYYLSSELSINKLWRLYNTQAETIWAENSFPKASNQIASAIYHRLQNTDLIGIKTVRLIADGCAGQNKNTTVVGMCAKWLSEAPSHIKSVELIFPVVGHSFIPPDRRFARIEKEIRKREIIANPEEYHEIIKECATLITLGNHCKVFDWKDAAADVFKPVGKWHFKFKSCKRYVLKCSKKEGNILIKGYVHYKHDDSTFKNVNLPGVLTSSLNPREIFATNSVSVAKATDVRKLLTNHYGNNWESIERLSFYVNLVSHNQSSEESDTQGGTHNMSDMICEPQESFTDLYV
ncbi:unnamed protein product [Leptidea sinapis]|uniref:DUF7869 domain-containing protein n=1 Tax=Leptidea sinapis TaxID=189913 RepID=A0A5E4PRG9_9NEOP|nr:unnamed protein product [Leptidea sinapis]